MHAHPVRGLKSLQFRPDLQWENCFDFVHETILEFHRNTRHCPVKYDKRREPNDFSNSSQKVKDPHHNHARLKVLRPQNLYHGGRTASRYFALDEHSYRKTSSVIKALWEHDVFIGTTGSACYIHKSICAKASWLHNVRISQNYYTHTVLRGFTRQNYRVWPTKLRRYGRLPCTLSILVAHLCVETTKSQHVLPPYDTSNFRFQNFRFLSVGMHKVEQCITEVNLKEGIS